MLKQSTTVLLLVMLASCNGNGAARVPDRPPPVPPAEPVPLEPALVEQARRQIADAAQAQEPLVRAHAMEAARSLGDQAEPILLRGLSDPQAVVRFAAAMAVGEMKLEVARPQLERLAEDTSRNVQIATRFALHRLGDYSRSHDFEKYVTDPDKRVRANAVVALGMLGEPSALKLLRPLQRDADPAVRLQVAEAMWRLGDQEGLRDLVAASISGHPDDQMIGLMALAGPRQPRVSGHIRPQLTSPYEQVRLIATRALGLLGFDDGYTIATRATRSKDANQRALAALALGAIGRNDAQPYLRRLLHDPMTDVRLAAATAIAQLSSRGPETAGF